jgi:hypothetical protein
MSGTDEGVCFRLAPSSLAGVEADVEGAVADGAAVDGVAVDGADGGGAGVATCTSALPTITTMGQRYRVIAA